MADDLFDAVYGCLVGGAIGDALGAPVENWHYRDVRRAHGTVSEFLPQPARAREGEPGQITDDTTLRHYLCLAIVELGGRVTPDDYARIWLERLNPDRLFMTERIVLEKLRLGMNPWDTGRGQPPADAATMSIAPIGIVNLGDPRQAYGDAFAIAGIHQDGFERDAAATMAAAQAVAVVPGSQAHDVVAAMLAHSTFDVRRLVERGSALAEKCTTVDAIAERFYATMLDPRFPTPPGERYDPERSVAPTSREVLPIVTALLLHCEGDAERCLVEGASFGRDADTIATVLGCLAGALSGASAIRPDWLEASQRANRDFFTELEGDPDANFRSMAERLVAVLDSERTRARRRAEALDALLSTPAAAD
jgi:ADP-ribosylglycohydrolase